MFFSLFLKDLFIFWELTIDGIRILGDWNFIRLFDFIFIIHVIIPWNFFMRPLWPIWIIILWRILWWILDWHIFDKVLINLGRYYILLYLLFNSILFYNHIWEIKKKRVGWGLGLREGNVFVLFFCFFWILFCLGTWRGHCHFSFLNTFHKSCTPCQLELDVKAIIDLHTLDDLLS